MEISLKFLNSNPVSSTSGGVNGAAAALNFGFRVTQGLLCSFFWGLLCFFGKGVIINNPKPKTLNPKPLGKGLGKLLWALALTCQDG